MNTTSPSGADRFVIGEKHLDLTPLGHSSLLWNWQGLIIHIDPWSAQADYTRLPKADVILITHEHQDHFDPATIHLIKKASTKIIANPAVCGLLGEGTVLRNFDTVTVEGVLIQAVPAYNNSPGREQFHPRGRDNGYVLNFDGWKVLVAGDTEDHPEIRQVAGLDVAFLPMNQPYTMTPEQVASLTKTLKPKILYPYHYRGTEPQTLVELLKSSPEIEVRIRSLA
ncbi:MAG: MBL fold metallo-hydrolase [Spirochaetales bacterium]|nr:MBL fold metallo-hydrolase [Spirochaetales bacterium]